MLILSTTSRRRSPSHLDTGVALVTTKPSTVFGSLYPCLQQPPDDKARNDVWEKFWRNYEPKIRSWAAGMRLDASQIDEITGRVMLKLVRVLPTFQYRPGESFSAWLRALVVNVVRDFWASSARRPGSVGPGGSDARENLEQQPDVDAAADALVSELDGPLRDREAKVQQAVRQVKERVKPTTWGAFELTALDGLSGKEAADRLNLKVTAVHMAKHRVANMLHKELSSLGVGG